MAPRTIHLHAFASAKGGVGKSTLAITAAKLAAQEGRRVALLDLDMTGSSLADGLQLSARDLPMDAQGTLSLTDAEGLGWLSVEDTRARRTRRMGRPGWRRWQAYLNEAFDANGAPDLSDLDLRALYWRHAADDGVLYLPSSALMKDVLRVVDFQFYQDAIRWPARLSWVLWRLLEAEPELDTLIFDLPPGLFGFAYSALSLAGNLSRAKEVPESYGFSPLIQAGITWRVFPWLVCSPDHNDLRSALSCPLLYNGELPGFTPLVNRCSQPEKTKAWVAREFDSVVGISGRLKPIEPEPHFLGQIFQQEHLDLPALQRANPGLVRSLMRLYSITGGEP